MLGRTGTTTAKARLHFALAARPGHPFTALLAGKPADGIPASYILACITEAVMSRITATAPAVLLLPARRRKPP
jgi:hypothetical protein